ncbi:hypothetical protein EKH77_29260 [Streptomyces luteoverticillatus]|uniref:Uncharacterized protein n=1 Tax=Streptomyces luteoverticillatus TaxID=66425 RepID=A0A3Q9G3I3_STRLT|nr:hypothetical protein EKH77_29260 [Streptomyces luteoverticillatus]
MTARPPAASSACPGRPCHGQQGRGRTETTLPAWPGRDRFTAPLLHSTDFRSPTPYRGRKVLVVGSGNAGSRFRGCRPSRAHRARRRGGRTGGRPRAPRHGPQRPAQREGRAACPRSRRSAGLNRARPRPPAPRAHPCPAGRLHSLRGGGPQVRRGAGSQPRPTAVPHASPPCSNHADSCCASAL